MIMSAESVELHHDPARGVFPLSATPKWEQNDDVEGGLEEDNGLSSEPLECREAEAPSEATESEGPLLVIPSVQSAFDAIDDLDQGMELDDIDGQVIDADGVNYPTPEPEELGVEDDGEEPCSSVNFFNDGNTMDPDNPNDMEEQREMYYRDREQRAREALEAAEARSRLPLAAQPIALKMLLLEAQRLYIREIRRHCCSGERYKKPGHITVVDGHDLGPAGEKPLRAKASRMWSEIAEHITQDLRFGHAPLELQRRLSCMCIFSPDLRERNYYESDADRLGRLNRMRETLARLDMQQARGGNPYFLEPESEPTDKDDLDDDLLFHSGSQHETSDSPTPPPQDDELSIDDGIIESSM